MALTDKQQAFINEYLIDFNATQAAIRAGYSERTAGSIGHENLTKPEISEEIKRRVADVAMTADEVLIRLADHARGSLADFIVVTKDGPSFDFRMAQEAGKLHLVKKLKTKTNTLELSAEGEEEPRRLVSMEVDFELYDAQAALVQLGRVHGLFTDKSEVDHSVDVKAPITYIREVRPADD